MQQTIELVTVAFPKHDIPNESDGSFGVDCLACGDNVNTKALDNHMVSKHGLRPYKETIVNSSERV